MLRHDETSAALLCVADETLRVGRTAALDAEPSPYDSHPAPRDRIAWVEALEAPGPGSGDDAEQKAWSLFEDRRAVEAQMTDEIRARVYDQLGVLVKAE